MDNVRRNANYDEEDASWLHGVGSPQCDGSTYTRGSIVYSNWNTTQISFDPQVYNNHISNNMPRPPSEGPISCLSDNSWLVIPQTEEMARGGIQMETPPFVANDTALDIRGSGGILDNFLSAFPGIPSFSDVQMAGAPNRVIDESSVPFSRTLQVANETDVYLSTAPHNPPHNSPWSAARPLRVPQYDVGYVAFMNGPESPSDKSSCDEFSEPHIQHPTTAFQFAQATKIDITSTPITAMSTAQHFEWQIHGPSVMASSESLDRTGGEAASGRRGRRNGPLTLKGRQDALVIRKHGACISCHFRKVKCSKDKVCDECRKHAPCKGICIRSIVECYGACYFPHVLTAHLRREQVETLISENIERFTDVQTIVKVTCGGVFESMNVTVNFFVNKTDELQFHHRLTTQDESEKSEVITEYSAPVGIMGMDKLLQAKCKTYVKSMVSNPNYVFQVTAGDPTAVCGDVLQVVHDYFLKENDGLLDRAMQLHGMHFFMRTLITFTPESSAMLAKADGVLRDIVSPPDRYQSSRLLGRELKCNMHDIHKPNLKKVLKEFEVYLKKKEATAWPICFCVVIILCLCTEDIQIATNNFISNDKKMFDQSRPGYQECLELENLPFAQLFHDAFGTHKKATGHGNMSSFNPILNRRESQTYWSKNAKDMVRGIREVVDRSYVEMRILSQRVVFEKNQFRLDYQGFLHDNPGRLLSKFLLSFIE